MNKNYTLIKYNLSDAFSLKFDFRRWVILFFVFVLSFNSFSQKIKKDSKIATDWASLTLSIMKTTPNGTPTFGSRFVGYAGLTMYETVVHGNPEYKSLVGKLNGLEYLPSPATSKINWTLALNAGQAQIIKSIYDFTSEYNYKRIDSLEQYYLAIESKGYSQKEIEASIEFGKSIANAIFEWSKTDGGHKGYLRNFDSTYALPKGNGKWSPPLKGQAAVALPLHPYWGKNRTFAKNNFTLPIPAMVDYDYTKGTTYYNYMREVYTVRQNLTHEQKEIANWWGDDPSETFSPPGHSYYMALVAVENSKADIFKASQTFAAVGMAVADAFINCWKTKYYYHVERPFNFIYYNMSTMWDLYWPEPPFPAFYSGHAGQASSAATVLTNMYGEKFEFVDESHVGRPKDMERLVEYKARHFNSFYEAAEESAMSRLYGGIHTRLDNEVGLVEGRKIGSNINQLFEK
ncbi:vanadium-dependent haloperoxidase [Lacihabitans sp. LS3-19]|uniref:vanadium-dependent haloperoxidase n=1 Tax=Lacihabitans sp. LS3-19 TaxID=2487335 RepID=UPI0020CC6F96|nr:vanadium-dependent haloperoxidase [Lacihabitans sp. LS3-19]